MDVLTKEERSPGEMVAGLLRTIAAYDPSLRVHGERTACYAEAVARKLGLAEGEVVAIYTAGLLHDIGRLTLSHELLDRDGPLSAEEYALVQSHPRAGAELLRRFRFLRVPAVLIAHHHERWDGYGYPYGLRGSLIPLGSRILAVADTFDALTWDQPGRPASDPESAIRIIRSLAGSQLDPSLTATFVELAETWGRESSGRTRNGAGMPQPTCL